MRRPAIVATTSPRSFRIARADGKAFAILLAAVALLAGARPAQAQVSGSLSVASDQRLRGYSLTGGRPAAALTLGYDAPSGLYADGAATVAPSQGVVALIGASIDAGYAWRTASALTIDAGLTRQHYTRYFSGSRVTGYSEAYVGVSSRSLSARLAYSPDYFAAGVDTLYASLDGVVRPGAAWRLTAHAGTLVHLAPTQASNARVFAYDIGLGGGHRSGPIDLRLDLSFRGPAASGARRTDRAALVASAAFVF